MPPADELRVRALLRAGGVAYYRFAEPHLVRRIGGAAIGLVTLTTAGLLPFVPPVHGVAPALGWAIAAAILLAGITVTIVLLRDDERITPRGTLPIALAAILAVGALRELAGSGAPYDDLAVLVIVWAGATHPPARVAALVAIALGAGVAGVAADPTQAGVVGCVVHVVTWSSLAGLAIGWTAAVRTQRALLHERSSEARALARVDALTGLGNRRAFDETLATEVARAARTGRPLSLIVGDLDQFKAINDRYGHLAGDDCLRQVAAVVNDTVRRPDACFRWGGDEFAVLLTDAELDGARVVGRRLSEGIEQTCRAPSGRPLSVGLGVATYDVGDTPDALLERADAALLLAKLPA